MAAALRLSPADLAAMAPPNRGPRRPLESGLCPRCLERASSTNPPAAWYRRWMHPVDYRLRIPRHLIDTGRKCALARVRHATEMVDLAYQVSSDGTQLSTEFAPADDAIWLQQKESARTTTRCGTVRRTPTCR